MDWKQVKHLLLEVLDQPPSRRIPFLEEQCQDDEKLRLEVLSLLEMDSEAEDFFSTPLLNLPNVAKEILGAKETTKTGINLATKQPAIKDTPQDDPVPLADSYHTRTEVMDNQADSDSMRTNAGAKPFRKDENEEIDWQGRALGDFILQEKFGEGGFGEVYRAEQPSLGREAVIKILHTEYHKDAEAVERFRREAKLASRLEHPYAAHIYDFGIEADGLIWIAMELVRGTPLNKILKTQGTMALERFVPLFTKICEVIHTAHEYGIIHRDIKPANIMVLTRAGRMLPKLLDFGIAKDLSSNLKSLEPENGSSETIATSNVEVDNTEHFGRGGTTGVSTKVIGSPHYMAPEQWENGVLTDSRTDIYALGILAYECLCGETPFNGDLRDLYNGHTKKTPPSLGNKYPEAVNLAILKALAKKPSERYGTTLEFANRLQSAMGLSESGLALPQLNETIRQEFINIAPQPIAEVLANFGTARNIYQAKEQLLVLTQLILRYLGILTLACRIQIGSGNDKDSELVIGATKKLLQKGLSDEEWLELMRELSIPFISKKDAYPIPELITFFFGRQRTKDQHEPTRFNELITDILELSQIRDLSEDELHTLLIAKLRLIELLLVKLAFLGNYALVVAQNGYLERWVGLGRIKDPLNPRTSSHYPEEKPLIINREGELILSLWPLAQIYKPTPAARDELFFLEGRGRNGAKLVALPTGFEHQDEKIWEVFSSSFFSLEKEGTNTADHELTPYLGLSPFSSSDTNIFFGRERETERFLNRLQVETLIAVVGPSGAGKSSFIQAGVVPALPANSQVITFRPGANPWLTLETQLAALGLESKDLMRQVKRSGESLGKILTGFATKQRCKVFLVVDQFEEIFTLCLDEEARQLFGIALTKAVRTAADPVRIILTLRDDFLMRTKELPSLGEQLNYELLTTPKLDDLVRILTEPARKVGYEFEDDELPLEMAQAVAERRGSLPLLAFTAAKLWDFRDRALKQLKRKTYEAMGGVGGALAGHAEETLNQMTQQEQKMVREIFRRLVTSEGTRAVITRPELYQILGQELTAKQVLERLINKRLLAAHEGEDSSERIEIIHEALISAWPRLVNWRQEDAVGARMRDQLQAAARQWQERGRPQGLLWRKEALLEYEVWRKSYPGKLTEVEEAFGQTSISDNARSQRLERNILAAIILTLIIGISVVFYQKYETQRQLLETLRLYEEQGRQELFKDNANGAAVYLSEAYLKGANSLPLQFMLTQALWTIENRPPVSLEAHTAPVNGVQFSADGKLLVTASADKTAKLWDTTNNQMLYNLSGHTDAIVQTAFSPDSQLVVTASADKTAKVWQANTGNLIATLTGHTDGLLAVNFSPDGEKIVTASYDGTARLWAANSGELLATLSGGQNSSTIYSASFSPDGQWLVTTGHDKTVKLWEVKTGKLLRTFPGHTGAVLAASFSPDSSFLVTASTDQTAKIWDIAKGKLLTSLTGHQDGVVSVAFNHQGDKILTASNDSTARVWQVSGGKQLAILEGHKENIFAAHFSPNERFIITAGYDGTVKVWETATGKFLVSLLGHKGAVIAAHFSPDNNHIATASSDNTVKIWDMELDTRSAKEIASIVHQRVSIHLDEGRLAGEVVTVANNNKPTDTNSTTTASAKKVPLEAIAKRGQDLREVLQRFEFETIAGGAEGLIPKRTFSANYFAEDLGSDVALEMVEIPAGTFMMGSPKDSPDFSANEGPQHAVTLSGFYMGKYEVTQTQWRAVANLPKVQRELKTRPSYFKGDNFPVEQVSWEDAIEFCARLTKATGRNYALPTEAQWEYACRAGKKNDYAESLNEMAWYQVNEGKTTHSVGGKSPNAWGLYDTYGNAFEMCNDWYSETYYQASPSIDPQGPNTGDDRLVRGGSMDAEGRLCRSTFRSYNTPSRPHGRIGFRIAMVSK